MKNIYLLICVLCVLNMKSQTPFWFENFGTGTGCSADQGFLLGNYSDGLGTWSSNTFSVTSNGTYANIWYVSETEAGRNVGECGNGCLDSAGLLNRTMHIGSVAGSPHAALCPTGDCGALYDPGVGNGQVVTDIRAESYTISCLGKTTISLQFDYILRGDTAHDYLTVWYFDGASWTQLGKPVPTSTCINSSAPAPADTEGVWATLTYNLPASANNNGAVKVGFKWVNNDDGIGSMPSVAIDNVTLLALNTAPLPTTLTVNIVPPDSANHNFIYCTNTPYNFNGVANPGPITFYQWSSVSSATVNAHFNPSPAWQNGEAITFPAAGTYTLTLTCNSQNNGVNDTTLVVTVVQTPTITVTPPNPFVCSGGTTGIDLAASGALTYTWTNAPTTVPPTYLDANADTVNVNPQTIQSLPRAFNYSVTGTAADGCKSNQVVATVTVIAIPTPVFSPVDTVCSGLAGTMYVDSMPVTTTYTWTAPPTAGLGTNSGSSVQATPIYFNYGNSQNDTLVYYQVLMNVPGCPPYNPHTLYMVVEPLPHVQATDTIDNCNGMGDTLKAVYTPTTNVTLIWMPKASSTTLTGLSGNPNEVKVNPTSPKWYYVTPVNQFGCKGQKDSTLVLIGDTTTASITQEYHIICSGQNVVLTAGPQNNPSVNNSYHYTWGVLPGGSTYSATSTSTTGDTVLVAPTQSTIYTVTVHGTCVKHNIAQASIQVNQCTTPIPVLSANTHTVCIGQNVTGAGGNCIYYKDSTQYTSTKPLTYTFVFNGAQTPNGHIFAPAPDGDPNSISYVSGDTLFYSMTNNVPLPKIKVCYYVNSLLNENDPAHGVYGYYPVTEIVKNGIGQIDSLQDSVKVYPGPIANANGHQIVTISQGNSATLCSTGSYTYTTTYYNWSQPDSAAMSCPNCPCAVVTPTTTMQYTLTLTDYNGCISTDTISVIVDVICRDIFVANAFSPNGDGLNDVLHVKSNCELVNMSFKIFDRWGEKVFESTDESVGWDGTYKNKPMSSDVYMYTVDGFLSNGKEAKKKGNVTLLR
jgi:gliding motility-associated-like protein